MTVAVRSLPTDDETALASQLQRARSDYDRHPTDRSYIKLLEIERVASRRQIRMRDQEIFALRRKLLERRPPASQR